MSDTNKELSEAHIRVILAELLGPIIFWKPPSIQKSVGPYNSSAFEDFENKLSIAIDIERNIISGFLLDYPDPLFDEYGKLKTGILKKRKLHLQNFANDLMDSRPEWFAGGFGNVEYTADFEYWSAMGKLSQIEATCLSIGFDPKHFNVNAFNIPVERGYIYSEVPRFFFRRLSQFRRKFDISDANEAAVTANDWANWVEHVNIEVHSDFLSTLRKNSSKTIGSTNLDQREKTSLLNVIAILAKESYNYVPTKRSDVVAELYEAAQRNDVQITKETIRKHLKAAVGLLENDWKRD